MITYEKYAEIRDSKGLKDIDVARKAGIQPSTFSEWKKGKCTPKFDKMSKIAEALGLLYFEFVEPEGSAAKASNMDMLIEKPSMDSEINAEALELGKKILDLPKDKQDALQKYLQFLLSDS